MRKIVSLVFALTIMLVAIPVATAQDGTPSAAGESLLAGLGLPEIVVTTDGTDFDPPTEIEAGRYRVVLVNTSESTATDLEFYKAPEGMTVDDINQAFMEMDPESGLPPDVFFEPGFAHGGAVAWPGSEGDVVLDLTPGDWGLILQSYDASTDSFEGTSSEPMVLTVTGEMPEIEDPAVDVEVSMVEMAFNMPDTVAAGPGVWKVASDGALPHHMRIQAVDGTVTVEQVMATINMFFEIPATPAADGSMVEPLDPDSIVEVDGTLALSTGAANWIEFDLEPGTYIAMCFFPSPGDPTPHAALGMVKVFTVE